MIGACSFAAGKDLSVALHAGGRHADRALDAATCRFFRRADVEDDRRDVLVDIGLLDELGPRDEVVLRLPLGHALVIDLGVLVAHARSPCAATAGSSGRSRPGRRTRAASILSAGSSFAATLSQAGYGMLIAPGIVPCWKRGSGRESISTTLASGFSTCLRTNSKLTRSSLATLTGPFRMTSVAHFWPSFSTYAMRVSCPLRASSRYSGASWACRRR